MFQDKDYREKVEQIELSGVKDRVSHKRMERRYEATIDPSHRGLCVVLKPRH